MIFVKAYFFEEFVYDIMNEYFLYPEEAFEKWYIATNSRDYAISFNIIETNPSYRSYILVYYERDAHLVKPVEHQF